MGILTALWVPITQIALGIGMVNGADAITFKQKPEPKIREMTSQENKLLDETLDFLKRD